MAAMRGIRKGVVVLGAVLVGVMAVPAAASADMGGTGADLGGHVATCTQDMGFDGQHNPGMHEGYANWDMTRMG
ncbi:MAG: hypothetical protein WA890_03415 [Micromonospora sp.]